MFLENELSSTLSLDGEWEFKLGGGPTRTIPVPSAWEAHIADKITEGPAIYRRQFTVPESWLGSVIVLEADAVSFHAAVRVNGQVAGAHEGMWSAFQIEVTPYVRAGENTLEIEVWKPGGRFPLRETLSGFLPDVAATFGGIWQSIRLRVFSWAALSDVHLFAYGGGWLDVQGRIIGLGERRKNEVVVDILDAENKSVARARGDIADDHTLAAHIETGHVQNWATRVDAPLYSVRVSLYSREAEIACVTRRVGFRDLEIENGKVTLGESPLHVRGVLDWGWNATHICPTPLRTDLLGAFAKARALGFNMFKLCLFVPDETTFDVADETGMLLWLEMPMWLPRVTPALRDLALREYRDLFRRLHHHPSIAIVSLGCELNAQVDAEFLADLSQLARDWFPNALHCDNSGSAEAYGGVLTSLSDFYDYHFYTDPHFFQPLVQHFSRAYQPIKPWIYGEFCDADTLRDYSLLDPEPWWLTEPTPLTGGDFVHTRDYRTRLRNANVTDGGAALTGIARQQATAVRKFIVEQVRTNSAVGGYVITGWMDTPIATSGVVDDRRELKFPADAWRQFNADRVLIIDRERRRHWIGDDRPAHKDPFTWWQGETAEIHVALSNGGDAMNDARLEWRLADSTGVEVSSGRKTTSVDAGEVKELTVLKVPMPQSAGVVELTLNATITDVDRSSAVIQNTWQLWAIPPLPMREGLGVRARPRFLHNLSNDTLTRVRAGESILVWLTSPDSRFTRSLPFWREAIHVFEPHPLWERVPQPGHADMRFFGVASDFAIDPGKLAEVLGPDAKLTHVWRRFDARAMTWADYVIEARLGAGILRLATLRFEGGLGCQPDTFDANPMGAWLLESLLNA